MQEIFLNDNNIFGIFEQQENNMTNKNDLFKLPLNTGYVKSGFYKFKIIKKLKKKKS